MTKNVDGYMLQRSDSKTGTKSKFKSFFMRRRQEEEMVIKTHYRLLMQFSGALVAHAFVLLMDSLGYIGQ